MLGVSHMEVEGAIRFMIYAMIVLLVIVAIQSIYIFLLRKTIVHLGIKNKFAHFG